MEYLSNKNFENKEKPQPVEFESESYDEYERRVFYSSDFHRHHEPRLAADSHSLVNEAVEIPQDNLIVLDENSDSRYAKTFVGPCILLVAHNLAKQKLGAIHFDAKNDIGLLVDRLKSDLGVDNFDDYDVSIVGGIKANDTGEMIASEKLRNNLVDYLNEQKIKIHYDGTLKLKESAYRGHAPGWEWLFYEPLIVDRVSGQVLSYNASSDLIERKTKDVQEEDSLPDYSAVIDQKNAA